MRNKLNNIYSQMILCALIPVIAISADIDSLRLQFNLNATMRYVGQFDFFIDGSGKNLMLLNSEIDSLAKFYYSLVSESSYFNLYRTYSCFGIGHLIPYIEELQSIDGMQVKLDKSQFIRISFDSVKCILKDNGRHLDTTLVHINNPFCQWIAMPYLTETNLDDSLSSAYIKPIEVKLNTNQDSIGFKILNRGDKVNILLSDGIRSLIVAHTFDITSKNFKAYSGTIDIGILTSKPVENIYEKMVWIKSENDQTIELKEKPNIKSNNLNYCEHGTPSILLKIENNWAYIKQLNGYNEINGWVRLLNISFDTVKAYSYDERRKIMLKEIFRAHPEWPKEIKDLISSGRIRIGMSSAQVFASLGPPIDINKTIGSWGVHEQWIYENNIYLYFENDVLTSYQEY